jgi:hypothetical protein
LPAHSWIAADQASFYLSAQQAVIAAGKEMSHDTDDTEI